jgi:hypothetical protein
MQVAFGMVQVQSSEEIWEFGGVNRAYENARGGHRGIGCCSILVVRWVAVFGYVAVGGYE